MLSLTCTEGWEEGWPSAVKNLLPGWGRPGGGSGRGESSDKNDFARFFSLSMDCISTEFDVSPEYNREFLEGVKRPPAWAQLMGVHRLPRRSHRSLVIFYSHNPPPFRPLDCRSPAVARICNIRMKPTKSFRVNKSKSPGKSEIDKVTENINDIAVINQANINKVKEFMDHVTTKSPSMNNKKISAIKNANSLKALKESGFFNFDFFDNKTSTTHFKITQEEIEKVFKLIDKKHGGTKISLKELENKMAIINPNFPKDQISTLTNGKSEIKATELFELLKDNELADFDPITEVYRILDKDKENNLNINHLQKIFQELGMGSMDDKDKEILKECLKIQGQNDITLEGFKKLFSYLKESEEVEPKPSPSHNPGKE